MMQALGVGCGRGNCRGRDFLMGWRPAGIEGGWSGFGGVDGGGDGEDGVDAGHVQEVCDAG
jgi:hypothetical protein